MKNLIVAKTRLRAFLLLLSFLIGMVFTDVAKASEVTVSATIPDIIAPSIPILIEPTDGALLSDNTPTFSWYESTDNLALSHYVFYLNGGILFGNLPLVTTETSQYELEYDSLNGIYSLTVKNGLTDRAHTWKVEAVDYADNSSSSDTWDFTIDTLVPSFILTKIGDTSVNISAANPASVPSSSILIFQNDATANEPILIANGEANSTVELTVTIPGDPTQSFTTTIDGGGNYELQLGILPRDTDIRLDFIITDRVGHVSVLEEVYFRIALQYYPTANPTTSVAASPSPGVSVSPAPSYSVSPTTAVSGFLTPTVSPSVSLSINPSGIIPIIPPREIIHEAVGEAIELLPESTAAKIREFLSSTLWQSLSVWFAWLMLILFYVLAYLLLISKFLNDLSGLIFSKLAALLFPQLTQAWQNLVFDYRATLASPLVKVELLDENKERLDLAITDINGNFNDLSWPIGKKWSLRVDDSNFYFPVGGDKPSQLHFWQFYQGQIFSQENYFDRPILIPTLRAAGQERLPLIERLRIFYLYLLAYPWWFWLLMTMMALIFVLRYQGLFNYFALGFYLIIGLHKLWQSFRSQRKLLIKVELKGSDRQFSDNLVMSLFENKSKLKQAMILPFDFAKAEVLIHEFSEVDVCTFSQFLALQKDEQKVAENHIALNEAKQEIVLQIGKI